MTRPWITRIVATLTLTSSAVLAQGPPRGGDGPPPPPPLVAALDANHDGVIDAQEIDNAAAALRTLDKNKDGKLTPDEFRPPRPPGGERRGPGGGGEDERRPPRGDEGRPPAR
jgi:hypothetical protein